MEAMTPETQAAFLRLTVRSLERIERVLKARGDMPE